MKKTHRTLSIIARILIIITVITLTAIPALAASYPKPKNNVADEAGVLSESTIRAIETANKTLKLDTETTIAVCTVDTTGDTDISEYARGVFKEWKLGEGVLLLIAKDDNNYYFVQSVGVESVLSNDVLKTIRDEYLEDDFEAGNIDRGVNKCVTKIKNVLTAGIPAAEDENTDTSSTEKKEGSTVGSVIAGFFKTILYIILIIVLLLVAFFIGAILNDDIAALFRRYILRIPEQRKMPEEYYDERLYGTPQRRRQGQGGYNQRGDNRLPPRQGQQRLAPPSYNQNPQGNRNRPNGNRNPQNGRDNNQYGSQYGSNYGNSNPQRRDQNRPQNRNTRPAQSNYNDGSETRAFSIPGRGDNNNNYR